MLLIVCRRRVIIYQHGAMKAAPSALRRIVADNVRRLRRELAMSQEELAGQAQLHRTYVGAIERAERNISLDNVERLAMALKVTPARLLTPEAG
jgi:transcriptional regulator with XRE-family HTH domain